WELAKTQGRLTRLGAQCGVPITFFHGRGGSVSRGGAPTGRAIAAQPAGSIAGRLRLTEQGEVVSFKYANRGTAAYQIELLAASGLGTFVAVRGARGEALLQRMFEDSPLFRLIVDEAEKTLAYVDLDIAREYAGLVADPSVREAIFPLIEEEYRRTVNAVLRVT